MSGDLRAAVEGLPTVGHHVDIDDVLTLIPEGAVLVTEEDTRWWCPGWGTLNAKRYHGGDGPCTDGCGQTAYAVLRHLREGT